MNKKQKLQLEKEKQLKLERDKKIRIKSCLKNISMMKKNLRKNRK